jgi:hypothetical protein
MKLYILKGCHYSTFIPKFYKAKDFNKSVYIKFSDSCLYEINEPSCVNKLWGFAYGLGIHRNSVRFGWTAVDDKI